LVAAIFTISEENPFFSQFDQSIEQQARQPEVEAVMKWSR